MSDWSYSTRIRPRESGRVDSSGILRRPGRVLVVIAYRDLDGDWHGLNAWPASGRDLATYQEGAGDGEQA